MIQKNSLVLYKKQPAVVNEYDGDKFIIEFQTTAKTQTKNAQYGTKKVREKDIILLNQCCSSLETAINFIDDTLDSSITETWELLQSDENTKNEKINFEELVELVKNKAKPEEYYFIFKKLDESKEFLLDEDSYKLNELFFIPRNQEQIDEINQKNYEKEHEQEIHEKFLERLKNRNLEKEDSRYMTEIENVALGKTEKSKTLVELKIAQTPENAHKLLLETGIWQITKNPYPTRFNLSMTSAQEGLGTPPEEERLEIPGYAYAIDNEWSPDPDDAINFDGKYLWVHIADPASFVLPDSSIDKTARNRGSTLYIPEGAVRMLSEKSLPEYALGLNEKSRALSFRILLNEENAIAECEIFKTFVKVKRLTYKQATEQKESAELKPLFEIAKRNLERRKKSGAINIEMPEIHISVDSETKKVEIQPIVRYEADAMVCEMMLLAGEGAAHFAMNNRIPFPYVSQEKPEIPSKIKEGLAGQFQILKCMRKRSVGITPAMHFSLGLALYSQVTSPLRRYGDLIAHQQLRAFLDKRKLLDKDTMLERISQGDAASVAAKKASRLSETHWKLIYLLQNPDWKGFGTCIDIRGNDSIVMIESLALQTTLKNIKLELNQKVELKVEKIDITSQEVIFLKTNLQALD